MSNKKYTIEEIKNMSETEWEAFRSSKWEEKKAQYAGSVPEFYLPNKNNFVNFIKKQNEKNIKIGKAPTTIDLDKIEAMDNDAWQEYRNQQWSKKAAAYTGPVATWYLKDKAGYLAFMGKNNR